MNQQQNMKYEFEDLKNIVKEGWMDKQSRFLKKWHKRWVVLTNFSVYTFKKQEQYINPTEVIDLHQIVSIKQPEEHELQNMNSIVKITKNSRESKLMTPFFIQLSKMSNNNNNGSVQLAVKLQQ
ncbi:unnamed protein product [Paramecium sonneborni]|uniref:PH domain-containing protein n=1 Tax=Paramecium sonneborni TaxID=65129 RepID=A0A8S1QBQ1_9CILI|nr:unnamed protein product [Paramecium sonneborni]